MRLIRIYIFFLLVSLFSCREIYEPEILGIDYGLLVAEGFVEVGGGTSVIKLGKTTTIYSEESIRHIDNAKITLLGSMSGSWQFGYLGEGEYRLEADLPVDQQYKLEIYVAEVEHYESEWMIPLISPEIEDIYFSREEDGVYIYLNTQGSDEKMYYQWTSTETWEFKTPYITIYKYDPSIEDVVLRDDNINLCLKSEESSNIQLGSTLRTIDGSITGEEINRIPLFSEKLGSKYSIEVTQKPLDQMAYEFYESIRKNTDDIGNIFSPMPSILASNLTKVGEPDTPVIGYISAGKTAKKRLFIEFTDIRPWSVRIPEYANCARIDTVPNFLYTSLFNLDRLIPLEEITIEWPPRSGIRIPAFISSEKKCVDCRVRGTTEKPDFWD